jgi:hypothetical protein
MQPKPFLHNGGWKIAAEQQFRPNDVFISQDTMILKWGTPALGAEVALFGACFAVTSKSVKRTLTSLMDCE